MVKAALVGLASVFAASNAAVIKRDDFQNSAIRITKELEGKDMCVRWNLDCRTFGIANYRGSQISTICKQSELTKNVILAGCKAGDILISAEAANATGWSVAHDQEHNFISRSEDGQLVSNGDIYRFASFNSPDLLRNGPWQQEDLLQTLAKGFANPTTRTYTLTVTSKPHLGKGHIHAYNDATGLFVFNEDEMKKVDKAIEIAGRLGVKLIIPFINQDYGDESKNWVGNFNTIKQMVHNIADYKEAQQINFFEDRKTIEAFKTLIGQVLTRVNTFNGKRLADDPAILAWETGNEMNGGNKTAAPGNWTVEIAKHIKSISPTALVMDGSFARTYNTSERYPIEVLESPYVDILSNHYYGSGDLRLLKEDVELVRSYGKVYIAGEWGFTRPAENFRKFLKQGQELGLAGSMVWSLRGHNHESGFNVHKEDHGFKSYTTPGRANDGNEWFDIDEPEVVEFTRDASYAMAGLPVPNHPTPGMPEGWRKGDGSYSFKSGYWTQATEVRAFPNAETTDIAESRLVADNVSEHFKAQCVVVRLNATAGEYLRFRGIGVEGQLGPWSPALLVK